MFEVEAEWVLGEGKTMKKVMSLICILCLGLGCVAQKVQYENPGGIDTAKVRFIALGQLGYPYVCSATGEKQYIGEGIGGLIVGDPLGSYEEFFGPKASISAGKFVVLGVETLTQEQQAYTIDYGSCDVAGQVFLRTGREYVVKFSIADRQCFLETFHLDPQRKLVLEPMAQVEHRCE